jgi:hypothetical protein
MAHIKDPVLVQTFVTESAVERLDVGVLIRFAWLDQTQLPVVSVRPFQHRAPRELLAIVGPDNVRIAATLADAAENAYQVISAQCVFGMGNNAFGGRVIDDAEDLELAPVREAIEDEVDRPNRIG